MKNSKVTRKNPYIYLLFILFNFLKLFSKALKRHVDDEDKGVGEIPTPGGKQNMILINESGLYGLILGFKLPLAKNSREG